MTRQSFSFLSTEKLFAIIELAIFININEFLADFALDTIYSFASLNLLSLSFTRRNVCPKTLSRFSSSILNLL